MFYCSNPSIHGKRCQHCRVHVCLFPFWVWVRLSYLSTSTSLWSLDMSISIMEEKNNGEASWCLMPACKRVQNQSLIAVGNISPVFCFVTHVWYSSGCFLSRLNNKLPSFKIRSPQHHRSYKCESLPISCVLCQFSLGYPSRLVSHGLLDFWVAPVIRRLDLLVILVGVKRISPIFLS